MTDSLRISNKILNKMKRVITLKPSITLSVLDVLDVYNIKKHSPNIEEERLHRILLCSLPQDHLVNKFSVKTDSYNISVGTHKICIKEIPLSNMKKWKEYKSTKGIIVDYRPHQEVTSLDVTQFIDFCSENNITEERLWHLLLDDTYSKSEEIIKVFYPTIIPLPHYMTDFQKYNSHGLLFTSAKTGKSETCYRIYPQENYENVSVVTLLGTADRNIKRTGLLDGNGIFFIDEINKLGDIRSGDNVHSKTLDFINTYLEKGIEKRGVWGQAMSVRGTKTIIFSGNVNISRPGQKDFYHLMSKICSFGGDADKFGRRFGWLIYSTDLNPVEDTREIDHQIIDIINSFRNEIIRDKRIQKKILKIIYDNLDWVHEKDEEHRKRVKEYSEKVTSDAIKSFIKGMSLSNDMKLKFMSLKNIITNHIFHIIRNDTKGFFDEFEEEIYCEYNLLKELLCINQLENLTQQTTGETKRDRFKKYIEDNKINISERLDNETKEKIGKELKIPTSYVNVLITECKTKQT